MFGERQSEKQEQPHQGPPQYIRQEAWNPPGEGRSRPPSSRHALGVAVAASVGAAGLFAVVVALSPSPAANDQGAPQKQQVVTVTSAPPSAAPTPEVSKVPPSASVSPRVSVAPKPKPTVQAKPTPPPKPKPVVYKKLTPREWAKLVKSPDDHVGEAIQIYGHVTQFDAATGQDGFRADTDARRRSEYYEYSENTVLQQNVGADILADIVEGDLFTAKVLVLGSYDYDTQIGGSTTVPSFSVVSISVIGHQN